MLWTYHFSYFNGHVNAMSTSKAFQFVHWYEIFQSKRNEIHNIGHKQLFGGFTKLLLVISYQLCDLSTASQIQSSLNTNPINKHVKNGLHSHQIVLLPQFCVVKMQKVNNMGDVYEVDCYRQIGFWVRIGQISSCHFPIE